MVEQKKRNLNPQVFWERMGKEHRPTMAFGGKTTAQAVAWKKALLPKVLATLGEKPKRVAARPERVVRWQEDGLVKERWLIDVQENLSAALLLFRPAGLKRGEKRPAILCCHGHVPYGKNAPMGVAQTPEQAAEIRGDNYDFGVQLAKAGFVTYAIDWLGFGERAYDAKPHHYGGVHDDRCNVMQLCSTLLDRTVLGSNLHDAKVATDFVCSQPYVNAKRLGVMGKSLGGTMATWVSLYDPRFRATDVICYAGPFYNIAYQTYNVCGSQTTPGLYELCDVADLQGLIAPRALLLEIGIHDTTFLIGATTEHARRVKKIFEAGQALDALELDIFAGGHVWAANRSLAFFRKHLEAAWEA